MTASELMIDLYGIEQGDMVNHPRFCVVKFLRAIDAGKSLKRAKENYDLENDNYITFEHRYLYSKCGVGYIETETQLREWGPYVGPTLRQP